MSKSNLYEDLMMLKYLELGLKYLFYKHIHLKILKAIIDLGSIVNSIAIPLHFGQAPFGLLKEKCPGLKFSFDPNP